MKKFIKENYITLLILMVLTCLSLIPLPYYIDMPGGLISVEDRVVIENSTSSKGTYNLTYVSEIQATPFLYLIALIRKDWDIIKEQEMTLDNQTVEELYYLETLMLKEGNSNSILNAYSAAGKEYEIVSNDIMIGYVLDEAKTDLTVGDKILEINGIKTESELAIAEILSNVELNEEVKFLVENDSNLYDRKATMQEIDGEKILGISLITIKNIETTPNCELIYEDNESGPSGGLMTTLTIYDKLVEKDLTKGLTISGTGTMEEDGTVGAIGGVKYKLAGAVKNKADIFFVPNGENYEEAKELQKKYNYDIDIVGVSTFKEAIEYLSNN